MNRNHLSSLLLALAAHAAAAMPLPTDPYDYDPSFDGGVVIEDRFAAITTQNYQIASKLARLSNGDVVVAGIVPAAFQPAGANSNNIGLVRYGSDGSRVPWPSPTPAYSYFNNMYVDYPNSNAHTFNQVRDIAVIAGFIYVLVDAQAAIDDSDAYVLAFREDGSFIDIYGAFTTNLDEGGAGLVAYSIPNCNGVLSCPMLIAVGNYIVPAPSLSDYRHIITAKRFAIGTNGFPTFTPNGTLHVDTTFGPFGNGANDYIAADSSCVSASNCSVIATSVAAVRTNSLNPTVYVGGEYPSTGQLSDTVVLGIDGNSGALFSDFGDGGFKTTPFNLSQNFPADAAVAIVATTGGGRAADEVYVVAKVSLDCASGVGVAKLRGVNGVLDAAFGTAGKVVFGGSNNVFCPAPPVVTTNPFAAVLNGERLAIVGEQGLYDEPNNSVTYDPSLAIVRTTDGLVSDQRWRRPTQSNGTPWGAYSRWVSVISDGNARFTTAAILLDPNTGSTLFGTMRLSSDRIFGSGFE
ncbi:MAG: hypothetical protein ABIO74_12920 [Dokdonella sp.]